MRYPRMVWLVLMYCYAAVFTVGLALATYPECRFTPAAGLTCDRPYMLLGIIVAALGVILLVRNEILILRRT